MAKTLLTIKEYIKMESIDIVDFSGAIQTFKKYEASK